MSKDYAYVDGIANSPEETKKYSLQEVMEIRRELKEESKRRIEAERRAEAAERKNVMAEERAEAAERKNGRAELYLSAVNLIGDKGSNSGCTFRSMTSLLELINSCEFDNLPKSLMANYKLTTDRQWSTPNYLDSLSRSTVVHTNLQHGGLDLSKLKFGYLLEAHRNTYGWEIQDKLSELGEMLCAHIFGGDRASFDKIVDAETLRLEAVQRLLYAKSVFMAKPIDELDYIQPLVTVMEADLISRIQEHPSFICTQRVEVSAGQGTQLQGVTTVRMKKNDEIKTVVLSGTTDILIKEVGQCDPIIRVQELKAPFRQHGLFQTGAFSCKSQLCGQLFCLGEMKNNPDVIVGGLCDLFVYSVTIRIHSSDNVTKYFVSERVVDSRAYILCLLMNLFGLPMENIEQLTSSNKVSEQRTNSEPYFPLVDYESEEDGSLNGLTLRNVNLDGSFSAVEVPAAVIAFPVSTSSSPDAAMKGSKKEATKTVAMPVDSNELHFFRDNESDDDKDTRAPAKQQSQFPRQGRTVITRSQTAFLSDRNKENSSQQQKQSNSKYSDAYFEDQEEKVRELLIWDTMRLGFAPLTERELNSRNVETVQRWWA